MLGILSRFRLNIDLSYYIKNSLWTFLSQLVGAINSFILLIIFTNLTSQELFGQFHLILTIFGLVSIFSLTGFSTALFRSISKGFDGDYVKTLKFTFFVSLIGVFILNVIAIYFYFFGGENTNLGLVLSMSSIFFISQFVLNKWIYIYQGKENFKKLFQCNFYLSISKTIIMSILLFYNGSNILLTIIVYFSIVSIFNIVYTIRSLKLLSNSKKSKNLISYGLYLSKINIWILILGHVDKLIVGLLFGVVELAIYVVAMEIALNFKEFSKTIYKIAFPKFAKMYNLNFLISIPFLSIVFLISSIVTLIIIFILPYIIDFIFQSKYNESILFAQIILLGFPFWILNSFLIPVVENLKLKNLILYYSIFPQIIKLLLLSMIFFIPTILLLSISQFLYSFATFLLIFFYLKYKTKNIINEVE